MAIILTDVIVGEGLATPDQVRAAMASCGKDESRLPAALAAKGLLYGDSLETLYELAASRASEDAEGAAAAKARLRRSLSPPAPPPPPPPEATEAQKDPARTFGPFTLIQEIGRGSRSVVHRAWRPDPGRLFAVKVLDGAGDEARAGLALQIATKVRHSRIVRVHDSGAVGGRAFLAMDLVDGRSLADRIRSEPLPWKTAAQALAECAMAAQVAHDYGVLHRDLRPANILLDSSGRALVVDYGLARDSEDASLDLLVYRSPEQVEGRTRDVDARSDVYALGCTLYHAVVGAPPFTFTDFGAFFDRMRTARPDPPSKKRPGLPPELDAVILRCLEKKPGDRYGRSFDLAVDLRRILRGLRPLTAPPAPPARRKSPEIDEVTGLRTRRTLLREAEASLSGPYSMVLFDADQFRSLQDRDGADLRLRKIAGLFTDLPGSGGVAGRHGADSFLCLLPGVDKRAAADFAEKLRAAVPQTGVTISAGVAAAPADGAGTGAVLRAARRALAQAKRAGRDRVVAADRLEPDLTTVLPPRALMGRDAELSAAGDLLESIRRGHPAVLRVEGEPGSGRTRLLAELAARARTVGLLPLSVTCEDAKRPVPGAVLLSLLQEFYSRRDSSKKALWAKLSKPQRYLLRDAAPCFRSWAPELPAPEAREHAALLSQALDLAVRTMAGEMPLLLLLDDAAAADATSSAILRELIRGGNLPLGLAVAPQESALESANVLRTGPLTSDQIEALTCTILEGADLPDGFPERLAEASHGNPLYVEAALRGLGARGKIGREEGGWKIEPATPADLPSTLDQALLQLVDGLPPAAADLLGHAALMGSVVDVDALQALGPWRESDVLDLLDLLEDRGVVRSEPGGTFVFTSATLRDVRVRTLPPARLPEMRLKTSQVLADLYGAAIPESPPAAPAPAAPVVPPPPPAPVPLGDAGMDAAIRFIQALTTELKMGRLYPKESRMRVELRERLAEAAHEMTASSPRVTFAAGPQGVRVNDAALPAVAEGAGRSLVQIFQEKQLVALSLDRGVTGAELFQLLDAFGAAPQDRAKLPHVVLVHARSVPAEAPTVSRAKPSELEESAQAMMALPAAKLLSLETEKTLPALFNGLIEGKLQRLMEPIVDRLGAGLRESETGLRRQAAALIPRMMDQGSPPVREVLLRRLETPLAAAVAAEPDDLTFALLGNAVRAWISTSAALKHPRLTVAFASRLAFHPEIFKRGAIIKAAILSTLASMGPTATSEVTELLGKPDPTLREGAGRLAAMIGPAMVHPLVSLILTHGDITARRIAGMTLKDLGDGSRQLAGHVKLDTPPHVVRNVLSIFETTGAGGSDVAAVMRVAATHADGSVREAAGALLLRAKHLFSPILLSELLARPDAILQKSAIAAAKELRMREAGGGVLKIAETTQDEELLRAACNYFRECPTAEALPLLSKLFASKARAFGLLKGMSDSTRVAATEALRRLNHPDAKRMIDQALSDGSETVRRAAKS